MADIYSSTETDRSRVYPTVFSPRYLVFTRFRRILLRLMDQIATRSPDASHKPSGIGRLVDFGCGDLPYKPLLAHRVSEYIGLDLAENPKADHFIGLDSRSALPGNQADIVLSTYVLEHVDSPEGYLAEAYRMLKPGGHLLISTHGVWLYHPTPNDYWRWTSAGLKKIITAQSFEIIHFEGILGLCGTGVHLFQDSILIKLSPVFKKPWALVMQGLVALFDRLNSVEQRNRDGAMYVVLARKPL